MAKLYFRYGAMNSGKSTALLQAAYNYEERDQHVLLSKPAVDRKGGNDILSRLGARRPVDFVITPGDNVLSLFKEQEGDRDVDALFVDEAQFLSAEQVDQIMSIVVHEHVPVLAYGIRTDFRTDAFPGSRRLLEIAHSIEELKTICRCGRKAMFNGRVLDGRFVFDGDVVSIDGIDAGYESLCAECYSRESSGMRF